MLLARHRSLVKPLEPSSRAAALVGPNALMPAASRSSTMPAHERRLRADHDEVDLVRLAERDHRRMVGDVERDAFGLARDAGIARRAIEPVGERACRHLPGQRVLAPAGAEEENVHAGASPSTAARSRGTRPPTASTAPPRRRARRRDLLAGHESPGRIAAADRRPGRAGRGRRLHARPTGPSWCSRSKGGIVHVSPYPHEQARRLGLGLRRLLARLQVELRLEDGDLRHAPATPTPAGRSSMPATAPASAPAAARGGPLLGFVDW